MKTQILQKMQKGQKHVIKIIILSLFLSLNGFAQTKENDYLLVSKVIELTNTSLDSIYNLTKPLWTGSP